jgi:hypothetical protein
MKYQLIIYFDNPITRWQYSCKPEMPIVASDVLLRRTFRFKTVAEGYARGKCKDMQNVQWRVEPVQTTP